MVHPDAVFDTGLWTADLLAERAERYGLTVDEYKRRSLLGRGDLGAGGRHRGRLLSDDLAAAPAPRWPSTAATTASSDPVTPPGWLATSLVVGALVVVRPRARHLRQLAADLR
ncbi:MAG: hypothetical protein R2746_05915 [Acidimicrobiales bacterium]